MKNIAQIKDKRLKCLGYIEKETDLFIYVQIKKIEYYEIHLYKEHKYMNHQLQTFCHCEVSSLTEKPNNFSNIPTSFMLLKLINKKNYLELKTIKTRENSSSYAFHNDKIIIPAGFVLLHYSKYGDNYDGSKAEGYWNFNDFYFMK